MIITDFSELIRCHPYHQIALSDLSNRRLFNKLIYRWPCPHSIHPGWRTSLGTANLYHLGQDRGHGIEALGGVANKDPQDLKGDLAWRSRAILKQPKMLLEPGKPWEFLYQTWRSDGLRLGFSTSFPVSMDRFHPLISVSGTATILWYPQIWKDS